jgi:hypothetical protein
MCPGSWLPKGYQGEAEGEKPLIFLHFHEVLLALHKKSGQKTDPQVNKDFLASFWLSFKTRKPHFGRKKHHYGTLFVQSRYHREISTHTR